MIVGLTGSIGMGKSTVSEMFRGRFIPVLCLDSIAHRARGPNGRAVSAIAALIPNCLNAQGGVDPQRLREFAFASADNFKALDAIMGPIVIGAIEDFVDVCRSMKLAIIDAPILFEAGFDRYCDKTVVVSAGPEVQRERVLARGTMDVAQFEAILSKQLPDAEKRKRANYIIDTSGSLEWTREQVNNLILTHVG